MTMGEMNDMSLFEGAADNADLLEKLLKASLIHADETYQTPPQIIWVDNSTIATLGNFSASTGKAKSRKTFNVSALVAASLANGKVLQYTAKLPDDKRKILYVDTEQSRFHCHSVMQRILRLAGLPDNMNSENLVFFGLREYSPNLRLRLMEYALQTQLLPLAAHQQSHGWVAFSLPIAFPPAPHCQQTGKTRYPLPLG